MKCKKDIFSFKTSVSVHDNNIHRSQRSQLKTNNHSNTNGAPNATTNQNTNKKTSEISQAKRQKLTPEN